MKILVLNAGSSSLKFGVFDIASESREIFKGSFERFREGGCDFRFRCGKTDQSGSVRYADIGGAIAAIPGVLRQFDLGAPEAIGHRVAHGGSRFTAPAILDDATIGTIEELSPLAPLHNPGNLQAIRLCRALPASGPRAPCVKWSPITSTASN